MITVAKEPGVVLSAKGLSYAYGATAALRNVSLEVTRGEVVAVTGRSGSGKSTLLHCLAGLLLPQEGEVWVGDRRLDSLSEAVRSALRLRSFGFVFQFGELVPELSLVENVELPLRLLGRRARQTRGSALAMLDALGVAALADRRLSEVSGGEVQRAAVARALVHEPAVVFADEPTGALDESNATAVLDRLLGLARERGAGVVLVTHDEAVAAVADRRLVMRDGVLGAVGSLA
ncbi:MAG: ABC transporter ATP-binding protein [Streptomycetales bacterium]